MGQLNAVVKKMGGREAVLKFLRGELAITDPTTELPTTPKDFPTWKTVKLGTHQNVKELSQALTSRGFRIGDYAADILKRTPLAQTETEIELVQVTGRDLGFRKATRRDKIYARAQELGLDLVPAEVGPELRLVYSDQPMNEWVLMGMEPIAVSGGNPRVFRVGRYEDGIWLYTNYGRPGFEWDPDNRWVFARRK